MLPNFLFEKDTFNATKRKEKKNNFTKVSSAFHGERMNTLSMVSSLGKEEKLRGKNYYLIWISHLFFLF